MTDPVVVEVRFETDGDMRPIAFEWQGRRRKVASTGRRWQDGDERHYLVMDARQRVFELIYSASHGTWRARERSGRGGGANALA